MGVALFFFKIVNSINIFKKFQLAFARLNFLKLLISKNYFSKNFCWRDTNVFRLIFS